MDLTLPAAGFAVGVLIGLTGIGGGALMTPFLILVLGKVPVLAVGTDLVYGSVPGVTLGSWMAPRVSSQWLRAGLATLLLLTGVNLMSHS